MKRIIIADITDKPLIHALLQEYLRELSQYEDIPKNKSGQYEYPWLDFYWLDKDRYPYILRCNEKVAGFALVRKDINCYEMAEFYVLSEFRRRGLGTEFASVVIRKHPGRWHIGYNMNNISGHRFWKNIVSKLVNQFVNKQADEDNRQYLEFEIEYFLNQ